jgi:[ribosomal protein S18]-alanine N-acetyltransferase
MDLVIKKSDQKYLKEYTDLLQKTYEKFYVNEGLGLTKDCFSKEVFSSNDTQAYLKSNIQNNNQQKCWFAFSKTKLIGTITIKDKGEEFEITGFYVDSKYQGLGIGKKLWNKALEFTKNKDIVLDIYTHNTKAINIYKKWGFKVDKKKGTFFRHWPEWPEGLKAECLYMRYAK